MLATWWLKKMKRESEEKQAEARREGREEGLRMARKENIRRWHEEIRRQGFLEGRREERQRWEAWAWQMVADARAAGISITEPPSFDDE